MRPALLLALAVVALLAALAPAPASAAESSPFATGPVRAFDAAPDETRQISGRVLNADGTPATAATVQAHPLHGTSYPSAQTGPDGRYRLADVEDDDFALIAYDDTGRHIPMWFDGTFDQQQAKRVRPSATATDVDFRLVVGGTISGSISTASPTADLEGVSVEVLRVGDTSTWASFGTDPSGAYTSPALPAGEYQVAYSRRPGSRFLPRWWRSAPSQHARPR